jgi:ParB family chromosome partitioning protein
MQTTVNIDTITVPPNRMRQLRPQVVSEIAESIRSVGLINPISLQQCGSQYMLVAGRHRFEAIKQLEHTSIRAMVLDCTSADQVALAELDENLIRADLSPAERAPASA